MKTSMAANPEPMASAIAALAIPRYDLPSLPATLTAKEFEQLARLETEFDGLQKSFERAAEIILEIRDKQLYRQKYKTFEEYCRVRWNMGARRGRQLADGAAVLKNLEGLSASHDNGTMVPLPKNERQVRPLASLAPEAQREVWSEVATKAAEENREVTGKEVQRAVEQRKQPAFKLEADEAKQTMGDVYMEAAIEKVKQWAKPGQEISVSILQEAPLGLLTWDAAAAVHDELIERDLVKQRKFVQDPEIEKLAKKIYEIGAQGIVLPKWKDARGETVTFCCQVARWHLGEIYSLALVAKGAEDEAERSKAELSRVKSPKLIQQKIGDRRSQFQIGDLVRTSYGPKKETLRIVKIDGGCRCADYIDEINSGGRGKKRAPHFHFVVVHEGAKRKRDGSYREADFRYLNGYVYKEGNCVAVNGAWPKGSSGYEGSKSTGGIDTIYLVKRGAKPA